VDGRGRGGFRATEQRKKRGARAMVQTREAIVGRARACVRCAYLDEKWAQQLETPVEDDGAVDLIIDNNKNREKIRGSFAPSNRPDFRFTKKHMME